MDIVRLAIALFQRDLFFRRGQTSGLALGQIDLTAQTEQAQHAPVRAGVVAVEHGLDAHALSRERSKLPLRERDEHRELSVLQAVFLLVFAAADNDRVRRADQTHDQIHGKNDHQPQGQVSQGVGAQLPERFSL